MAHRIIPRAEWGARQVNGFYNRTPANLETWLHHSVTVAPDTVPPFNDDHAAVRQIESITHGRFGGGMAYTFLITPAGLIFEGHGIGRVGAHTAGHNRAGAGICLVGNYDNQEPTPAMLDALVWLLQHGQAAGWWRQARLNGGHRDTKATACPGARAYARIDQVNNGAAPAPDLTPPALLNPYGRPLLAVDGSRGELTIREWQHQMGTTPDGKISRPDSLLIREWQKHLRNRGLYPAPYKIDGDEGAGTIRATQSYFGTPADGKISRPDSQMVRRLQERLNAGTLLQ